MPYSFIKKASGGRERRRRWLQQPRRRRILQLQHGRYPLLLVAKNHQRRVQEAWRRGRRGSDNLLRKRKSPVVLQRKKVDWSKYKKTCSADRCTSQSQIGGVCVRHGAKVKRCSSVGCTNYAKNGGVCIKHGAKVKLCSSIGCANKVFIGGVCKRHGAKTKRCSRDGRTNQTKI
jgi:hypothetical protein